jgi:hypothetical protein
MRHTFQFFYAMRGIPMFRKLLLITAALIVPAALLTVATQEAAFALPLGVGTATCPVTSGGGSVSPGLSILGVPGNVNIGFQGTLGNTGALCAGAVTSPPGDHVIGGSFVGLGYFTPPSSTAPGSSCANFRGPDKVGVIKVQIHWTMTGAAIAPTVIRYSANVGSVTGPFNGKDTITLKAPVAAKAGSFVAGLPRTTKLVTTLPAPGALCTAVPHTAFTITGGAVAV